MKPPCSVCGKPSWARGLCNTHYAGKRYREKPGVREAILKRNEARRIPYSQWTEEKREVARANNRVYMQNHRNLLRGQWRGVTPKKPNMKARFVSGSAMSGSEAE